MWVIIAVVFFAAVGIATSGTKGSNTPTVTQVASTATAKPIATVAALPKVGEVAKQGGYVVTVNGVEKSSGYTGSLKAKDGYTLLAVDVTIGSDGKGVSSNGLYCSLKDGSGFKYNIQAINYKQPLLAGQNDIPVGDKVRGWVTFEIPKDAKGLVFQYEPAFADKVLIRVDLGL